MRSVAGLFILEQMQNFSDEVLRARWLENPYFQFFSHSTDGGS
jgi:IS5 family transposase